MTQQNQEENKVTVNQLLQMVAQLSPEEQGELQRKLDASWKEKWNNLISRVREKSNKLSPLSDEEILAEVKAARESRKGKAC